VNIVRLTVARLNATINVKGDTQTGALEQLGLTKPGETWGLMGTGPGLLCQQSVARVFGLVWNGTKPFLQSKPGPVANTTDHIAVFSTSLTVDFSAGGCSYLSCSGCVCHWKIGYSDVFTR
jgi:hypothetical protein